MKIKTYNHQQLSRMAKMLKENDETDHSLHTHKFDSETGRCECGITRSANSVYRSEVPPNYEGDQMDMHREIELFRLTEGRLPNKPTDAVTINTFKKFCKIYSSMTRKDKIQHQGIMQWAIFRNARKGFMTQRQLKEILKTLGDQS